MHKILDRIPTADLSHEDWLEYRRHSIGGSDAASIIGLNPWSSPYAVWADKLGKIPPKEDNEAMRLGRDLEDYVAKRFTEETGKKVRKENNIIVNPKYPYAHANVDRMIVGEDAGFEAKTTSALNLKKFKNGEYPATYYCQCVHYLMVTGCKRWYLGVLILGVGFKWFVIERDEGEIEALAKSEEAFWAYVESNTPPPVDGTESTTETISLLYPESNGDSVNLFAFETELKQYCDLNEQIKSLTALRDGVANKVKEFLSNAGRGESNLYKVSWVSAERKTFDTKKFMEDHKNINMDGYYKTSSYRTFKVTEKGE